MKKVSKAKRANTRGKVCSGCGIECIAPLNRISVNITSTALKYLHFCHDCCYYLLKEEVNYMSHIKESRWVRMVQARHDKIANTKSPSKNGK